ncbi:MAG: 50S ribosomal protein L29 [Calditrichaeota bacterium]|nr:MAG: 50S ribosomal protein L29 [Calditrichota bacterium]
MKASELRSLTLQELQDKLEDLMDELANLRIQRATLQLVDPNRIRMVKRDIARIKTLMREYELGISKPKEQTQ